MFQVGYLKFLQVYKEINHSWFMHLSWCLWLDNMQSKKFIVPYQKVGSGICLNKLHTSFVVNQIFQLIEMVVAHYEFWHDEFWHGCCTLFILMFIINLQVIDMLLFKAMEELGNIAEHAKQRHHIIGQYVVGRQGLVQDLGTKDQGNSDFLKNFYNTNYWNLYCSTNVPPLPLELGSPNKDELCIFYYGHFGLWSLVFVLSRNLFYQYCWMRKMALCNVTNVSCYKPVRFFDRLGLYTFLHATYENLGTGPHSPIELWAVPRAKGGSRFDFFFKFFFI